MTESAKGFVVTLDDRYTPEGAKAIREAIGMIRGGTTWRKRFWPHCGRSMGVADEDLKKHMVGYASTESDPYARRADLKRTSGVRNFDNGIQSGFEVDLRELDPSIKILRFYNSY